MSLRDFKKTPAIKASGMDLEQLHKALQTLVSRTVLVGIPESSSAREDGEPITNAAIGYISERGSPAANIPARPWLVPGIRENADTLVRLLRGVAQQVLRGGGAEQVEKGFHAVGIASVSGIRRRISDGLSPPLSPVTLYHRAMRGDEGAAWELSWRMAGTDAADGQLAKPLIDTGDFYRAINYIVTNRTR